MKEYIEREALNKVIDHEIEVCNSGIAKGALEMLKVRVEPAADVEEVVRCKNCSIGFEVETDHPLHPVRKYIYCPDRDEEVEPDGFCKWSKRRE